MKRLAILIFLATPAFAHQTPFNKLEYLKLTKGDAKAAQQLSWYCEGKGINQSDCIKSLDGVGNFKQEAVLACEQKKAAASLNIKIGNGIKDAPGSRAHRADGVDWHADNQRDPQGGRIHRHVYSDYDREKARNQEIRDHLVTWRNTSDSTSGDSTITSSVATSVGLDQGLVTQVMNFLVNYNTTTATEISKKSGIPEAVLRETYLAGQAAYNNPAINGITPTIICYKEEADCRNVPEGQNKTNTSYDPNAEKKDAEKKNPDENKTEKKDDKKGAENPPKAEESPKEFADVGNLEGKGEMMAGESTLDVSGIATPTIEDHSQLSPMESCVSAERKRLTDNLGRMNVDPNSLEVKETEDETAKKLLKFGYCDEQVIGKAACLAKKIKEDSVVAVTIQEERKEAAKQALESYKLTGMCDPNALGREFCKAEKYKWETTPKGVHEISTEGGQIGKPVKAGEIPRGFDH